MRRLRYFIVLLTLGFSTLVFAQQFSKQYDEAASAYQNGNFAEAEKLWVSIADEGDANAQYALGIMHLKKEALRSEDTTAFRYLVEAAKKQHVASMFNLGVAYWEGRGVARQPEKALNWWEVAARRDDAGAQYNLGLAYYIGEGRTQSIPKAIYWVQQAANNEHPQAIALLVTMQNTSPDSVQAAGKTAEPEQPNIMPNSDTGTAQEKVLAAHTDTSSAPNSRIHLSNKTTILHAAPDEKSAQVFTLKAGVSVRAVKTSANWTQIKVPRSYPVWVYKTFVQDMGDGRGKIKGNNVNIRPSTSTDNNISPPLGQLNDGQQVRIMTRRDSWVQIMPPESFPAWVISQDIQ